jgi:hypothetical protein
MNTYEEEEVQLHHSEHIASIFAVEEQVKQEICMKNAASELFHIPPKRRLNFTGL